MLQFSAAFRCFEKHHRLAPFGYIGRCAAAKIFYRGFDEKSTRKAALQQLFVQVEPRQAVFLRNKCWISRRKLQPRWKSLVSEFQFERKRIVVRNSNVTRRKNQCRSSEIQPEVIAASFCSRIFRQKYCGNPTFTRPAQSTVSPVPSNKPESFLSF